MKEAISAGIPCNQEINTVITMEDKPKFAIVTLLQDAVASAFAGKVSLANIKATDGTSLAHELRTGQSLPRNLALDFSPLLDVLHLPRLGGDQLALDTVMQAFADPLGELKRIF